MVPAQLLRGGVGFAGKSEERGRDFVLPPLDITAARRRHLKKCVENCGYQKTFWVCIRVALTIFLSGVVFQQTLPWDLPVVYCPFQWFHFIDNMKRFYYSYR